MYARGMHYAFYDTALMSGTTRKMLLIGRTCEIMGRDELTDRGYPLRTWNRYYILTNMSRPNISVYTKYTL